MPNAAECRYAKSHEWVFTDGGEAVVGISDHAQKEITDVVYVELPEVGRQVKQGEAVAVVESVKAAFDIYAPVSGEILAINEALASDPSIVNRSAHDEGWFFRVKLSAPAETETLMNHEAYVEHAKTPAK